MTETDNIRNRKFPEWRGLSAVNIAEGLADEFGYGPWGRAAMTLADALGAIGKGG